MNLFSLFLPGRLVVVLALLLGLSGCTAPTTRTPAAKAAATTGKRMVVRTTAYTHTEPGGSVNAIGTRLSFGSRRDYSAASDWSWLPLGTRFKMVSSPRTYVIEDYGSALVGRQTIDLYMPSRREVRNWGVRHLEIEILSPGSKAMSLKLLAPRCRNAHVARMVSQLRRQGVGPS